MQRPVQSLQRAFRLLYLVAGKEDGCSIQELAAGSGLKPITAYNLTRTLEAENFLRRTSPPLRFHLGRAIQELKQLDDGRQLLTHSSRALLKAQRSLPDAGFALLQWEDGDTYQRIAVTPAHYGHLIRRREYRVHSYEKTSSLLFLAFASPEEASTFYSKHPFDIEGARTWKNPGNLEQFLHKVRQLGWAQPDFPDRGYFRLAAPVWSSDGHMIAAIAAYALETSLTSSCRHQLVRTCRKIATDLTASLHKGQTQKTPRPHLPDADTSSTSRGSRARS